MAVSSIILDGVVPHVFRGTALSGDVWGRTVHFERGGSYLIESASGGGKSSLLSFLYASRSDYKGSILVDNRPLSAFSCKEVVHYRRHEASMLWQDLRLFPSLTLMENITLQNQLTAHQSEQTIREWVELLDLSHKIETPVRLLSWGQQQRVAFIRALCQPCDFLFMDEPVSHLDDVNAQRMASLLQSQQQQYGMAVVVTSVGKRLPYVYNQVFRLCD